MIGWDVLGPTGLKQAALARPAGTSPGGTGFWRPLILAALGEDDAAVASLRELTQERVLWFPRMPEWDPLRSHPGFQALEREMGLTPS